MNIDEANRLLEHHMDQHGLTALGWTSQLDTAKRRFGYCDVTNKVISLSRPLTVENPEDEVLDTILHEIAHARAFVEHSENCGHDERWKAICREIGARPVASYSEDEVVQPDAPWVLVHAETGEVFHSYMRKPTKDFSDIWIRGRKDETLGKLEIRAADQGPIKQFTRPVVEALNRELLEAIQKVLEKKGVTAEMTKGSFSEFEYQVAFKVQANLPEGKSPAQVAFEDVAKYFGLTGDDFEKTFRSEGKTFVLCGLKPNNRKYPVIGLCPDTGKRFKFGEEVLASLADKAV